MVDGHAGNLARVVVGLEIASLHDEGPSPSDIDIDGWHRIQSLQRLSEEGQNYVVLKRTRIKDERQ